MPGDPRVLLSMPQTPPMPAAPHRLLRGWQPPASIGMMPPTQQGPQFTQLNLAGGMCGSFSVDARGSSVEVCQAEAVTPEYKASSHTVVPPRSPEFAQLQHSSSTMHLPGHSLGADADLDSLLRKSRSMASMRSLTAAMSAVAQPPGRPLGIAAASPPAFASPLVAHRATMASPMRGSLSSSVLPGSSLTAPAGPGGASPFNLPKRGLLQQTAASRGPQRPPTVASPFPSQVSSSEHAVVRMTTPASFAAPEGLEVRTRTAGHASPSPAMMRRSVSTQALRVERVLAAVKSEKMLRPAASQHSSSLQSGSGPSPERQRPSGLAMAHDPTQGRAMSPQQHRISAQRQV